MMATDIYHIKLDRGLALAWVNSYSAVVVRTPGATLLFDPVSLRVPEDVSLDLIAVSHGHSDHWEPGLVAELQQRTGAVVAVPPFLASRLNSAGKGRGGLASGGVTPTLPGDQLKFSDVTVSALRCDHAASQPLAFLVRTIDNLAVYLPGDSSPFPGMRCLGSAEVAASEDMSSNCRPESGPDVLLWMGTALGDGARIADLVRPKVLLTYAIVPPAAGARARRILTRLTPEVQFHALERHQIFLYPSWVSQALPYETAEYWMPLMVSLSNHERIALRPFDSAQRRHAQGEGVVSLPNHPDIIGIIRDRFF